MALQEHELFILEHASHTEKLHHQQNDRGKRVPLGPIRLAISQIRFRPLQFVPLLTELDPSFPVNAFASQERCVMEILAYGRS